MGTEKEGEKDCSNASMVQVFRSIVTHHYRIIQPIFLYDGDDIQVCLREKNDRSLYKRKMALASISVCNQKKRIYISLSLDEQNTASPSTSMCEQKNESISLSLPAKNGVGFYLCVQSKKRIYMSLSLQGKKRRRLLSLCASKKHKFVSLLRRFVYI